MRFFILAIFQVAGDKPSPIHEPIARPSASYPSGEWMEYVRLDFAQSGWKDEVLAEYPPLKERGLTFIESKEHRAHLYATIESTVPSFGNGGTPSDQVKVLGRECWDLWQVVPEPGLSEEYRSLNATFFEWLEALGNGKDPGHA